MPNVTIERMKEGYSQIRNRALAHAFSYMNMMEGWGTGIPRLLKDMEAYGLREPEFIDMDSAFRVNLYRAPAETERAESAGEVPEKDGAVGPESLNTGAETLMIPEMPVQYRAVYRYACRDKRLDTAPSAR